MKIATLLALALVTGAACSSKAPAERKEAVAAAPEEPRPIEPAELAARTPTPAAAPSPAAAGIPNDFPKECIDYAALIDKLKTCDQIGGARAALTQAYDNVRSAWSMVPADRRAEVAVQCKTQADSLRNAAAATCGW
jgi:hypothetical protein